MSKIKVAVIGCGNIATSSHIPAYMKNEEVEIKYFCDLIPERAEKCVEKYGCGKAVVDYHDFLNDPDLDAVSVCTHNDFHSIISIDFLKAGKNVMCEKPAARILSEALEMQKVAKETGKVLNIGVCNRFNTYVMKIREIIDSGELGEIYHVYASFRAHRSIPGIGGDFTTSFTSVWNGSPLTPGAGRINGPSGVETYYNLNMNGCVNIMRALGNTDEYWVREDGVKMLGSYVMVAADLSIRPKGSIVETSLGLGIVVDTGTFIYSNPTQIDIAVAW